MSKRCDICGKGPVAGRTYTRKGKAKKEGGVGRHIARKNPRRFMVNLQSARALKDSPWRVVLMASSSWSHAFLTEKNHYLYPDLESDRAMLEQLRAGEYTAWRDVPLAQMEAAGQQEVLNWVCLAGAVAELGYKANILDWVETWVFNAPKCLAVFK
jgi:ribosomal protein L28